MLQLLEWRRDFRRDAGPLLRAAQQRHAEGVDALRAQLCSASASGELARACDAVEDEDENAWFADHSHRPRLLLNFGIATAVIGGLTTLAYVDRNGTGGHAVAIGSGILGGAALGGVGTIMLSKPGGDTRALTLLLAIPVAVGGAAAGGALAAYTSRKPGEGRFVTAAFPLSAAWLTSVGLTIDAW